ncbi:MAG: FecR domain-containing protein, partial [Pirellulales bacterium]
MSTLVDLPEQFFLLVDRYCSATNTADEAVELETLLRDNRDAERYFLDHCHLQAQLYQQHATVSAVRESLRSVINDLSVGYRSRVWNSVRRVVVTNLAASLMVAGLTVTIIMLSLALIVPDWERSTPVAKTPSTEFVARIERTSQADFDAASDGNFQNRDLFDDDKIVLNSGLAVIEYDTGARVVLEGPATYHVNGRNGGDLRVGKLVARVETPASQGFAVEVPGGRIVDLGTEFGVEVDADGGSEVAVLSGEVDLFGAGPRQRMRLAAGEGASIARQSGEISRQGDIALQLAGTMRSRLTILDTAPAHPLISSKDAFVVKPTAAKQSSFYSGGNGSRTGARTIDGNGLSDATFVETGDPIPATWSSHTDITHTGTPTMWLSTDVAGGSSEG